MSEKQELEKQLRDALDKEKADNDSASAKANESIAKAEKEGK